MILEVAAVAYGAGYLPAARWLYGRWRVQQQERPTHLRTFCSVSHDSYNRNDSCCYKSELNTHPAPNGELALFAMIVAWFWPFFLLTAFVRWNPPKAPSELQRELATRDARIAELEKINRDTSDE